MPRRRMLVDWANEEGSSGAVVVKCDDPKQVRDNIGCLGRVLEGVFLI